MGRTKSWLALVLAIVMVLGMAVPTAFAAGDLVVDLKLGNTVANDRVDFSIVEGTYATTILWDNVLPFDPSVYVEAGLCPSFANWEVVVGDEDIASASVMGNVLRVDGYEAGNTTITVSCVANTPYGDAWGPAPGNEYDSVTFATASIPVTVEDRVTPEPSFELAFAEDGETTPESTFIAEVNDDPLTVNVFQLFKDNADDWYLGNQMTKAFFGANGKLTAEITNGATEATVSAQDGKIVITPTKDAITDGDPVEIKVTVENTNTEVSEWGPDDEWTWDDSFEGTLQYWITPKVSTDVSKVELDINGKTAQPIKFTTVPKGTLSYAQILILDNNEQVIQANTPMECIPIGTSGVDFNAFLTTKAVVSEGKIVFVGVTVDGVFVKNVEIPFTITNTGSSAAVKVGATNIVTPVAVNDPLTVRHQFKVAFYNGAGKQITLANMPANVRAEVVKGDSIGWVSFNDANGVFTWYSGNSEGGESTIRVSADGMLSTEFVIKVTPITATITNAQPLLLDVDPTRTNHAVKLTFAGATIDDGSVRIVPKNWTIDDGYVSSPLEDNKIYGDKVGTATVLVYATSNGYGIKPIELKVVVKDNTKKPQITATPNPLNLDIKSDATGKKLTVEVSTTDKDFVNKIETIVVTDKETVAARQVVGIDNAVVVDDETSEVLITPLKVGKATLLVNGTDTDGKAFKEVEVTVNVVNTTADAPNTVALKPAATSLTKDVSEQTFSLDVGLFDSAKKEITKALAGDAGEITAAIVDYSAKEGDSEDILSLVVGGANVQTTTVSIPNATFDFRIKKAGRVKLELSNDGVSTVVIPITINALTLTASPSASIALDMKDEASNEASITLAASNGKSLSQLKVFDDDDGELGNEVVADTLQFIKVTKNGNTGLSFEGKANGKGTLWVTAVVSGTTTSPLKISYNVGNTLSIVPSKTAIELNLAEGQVYKTSLTLKPSNNGALTAMDYKLSADDVVSVDATQVAGATVVWDIEALKVGVTTMTISGKVDTKTVPDVTVTINVINSAGKNAITLSVGKSALDLETNKSTTATWSVLRGTLTDDTLAITANNPTGDGANVIEIAADGKTINALSLGTAKVKVTGKVDAETVESNEVTITVTAKPVPVGDAGVYINGVYFADGVYTNLEVPNNYKQTGFQITIKPETGDPIKVRSYTEYTPKSLPSGTSKKTKPVAGTVDTFTLKTSNSGGKTALIVYPDLMGAEKYVIGLNIVGKPETSSSTFAITQPNPKTKTLGYFFDYVTSIPADAWYTQPRYWTFTTSDPSVAKVKGSTGLIAFLKAGPVTLTATPRSGSKNKSLVSKFEVSLTVEDQYVNTKYFGAVFSSSPNKQKIVDAMNSQLFPMGTSAKLYGTTGQEVAAALLELIAQAGENDITAIYIDGAISNAGVISSDGFTMSLSDLAANMSNIKGKIFLTLNGDSAAFFNTKYVPATSADIFAAFAKAEAKAKSALGDVHNNNFWSGAKFHVITATATIAQKPSSPTKLAKIEDAYISLLTRDATTGNYINGLKRLDFNEMFAAMQTMTQSNIGCWPKGAELPVAMNYVAANP